MAYTCQCILVISSILNYTSVLNAYPTNEHLQTCKTASKHSLQAVVSIILGFSKELCKTWHSALKSMKIYCANADDIGVNLQPVKIKHMANHSKVCCDQRYQDKIAHCLTIPSWIGAWYIIADHGQLR